MNSIYLLFCREEKMIILNCAVKQAAVCSDENARAPKTQWHSWGKMNAKQSKQTSLCKANHRAKLNLSAP